MNNATLNCPPLNDYVTVTKNDAAAIQVARAIQVFFEHDWVCAITLAAAAEDMFPVANPDKDMFEFGKTELAKQFGIAQKEWIQQANARRDWLKHKTSHFPSKINFHQIDAVTYILRALNRLGSNGILVAEFGPLFLSWLERNIDKIGEVPVLDKHS